MAGVRVVAFALLACVLCSCGSDRAASDAGVDLAIPYCLPNERTCGPDDHCGGPCQADQSPCTDHMCFEGLNCVCAGDHMLCTAGPGVTCDMAAPDGPRDMSQRD